MRCPNCKIGNFSIEKYIPPMSGVIRSRAYFKCDSCGYKEMIR